MFKYDYKYAILLDKLRNGEDFISFWICQNYIQGGGVNQPLLLDIFASYIPYIQTFYIAFLSYAIAHM